MLKKYLDIHPEIQRSIYFGYPVVALESDIISTSIPYPQNIEISNNICKIIRMNGAIPATTAVINGILKIGLTEEEFELLLMNRISLSANVTDLPFVISKQLTCPTTLTATITIAKLLGLNIISTSRIDGFSEESSNHLQVSSHIQSICSEDIIIVCNDINTNTDIDITLNHLKSNNVITLEYGKKQSSTSRSINSTNEIVNLIKIKSDLNLKNGVLILGQNSKSIIDKIYSSANLASKIATNFSLTLKK